MLRLRAANASRGTSLSMTGRKRMVIYMPQVLEAANGPAEIVPCDESYS